LLDWRDSMTALQLVVSIPVILALEPVATPSHSDAAPAASVSTLVTTPLVIEGLTSDGTGLLYAPGRNAGSGVPCPIYRTSLDVRMVDVVGFVPAPPSGSGCSPSVDARRTRRMAGDRSGWWSPR
jgi:hypothetical protein